MIPVSSLPHIHCDINFPRVLVTGETDETAKFISEALSGCSVHHSQTLAEATSKLAHSFYDLIISEISPEGDSLTWFHRQFQMTKIPTIFFSEKSNLAGIIHAIELGAEHIAKPIHPLEFRTRILKIHADRQSRVHNQNDTMSFGQVQLNSSQQKLSLRCPVPHKCNGHEITRKLTPTEFRLLYFFLQNEGQTVSREAIHSKVWGDDTFVRSRAIDKHVHSLKNKLTDCYLEIECIYGQGYRLIKSKLINCADFKCKTMDYDTHS